MTLSQQEYIQKILRAHVYELAIETPLERASKLSQKLSNSIYVKREDLQAVHSFKIRGAFNKVAQLSEAERAKGVIAASAGNHAQGVALAAAHFSCPALIVMPLTTPDIKVDAVKNFGAAVIQVGDSFSDAEEHAKELGFEKGLTFVHPYDDPDVIAGQGTIATEVFKQCPSTPDYIFVCLGGGGLASGIALYAKAFFPQTKIIGVEPDDAASMHAALQANEPVSLQHVGVFADGVAVRKVGAETFRICKEFLDDIVLCSADEICAAIKDVFDDTRAILEPAGALGVAGCKKYVQENNIANKTFVTVATGANINFTRLRHVAERADIGQDREALFLVTIPETPGSFKNFIQLLGSKAITEFNYRYTSSKDAQVLVGIAVSSAKERQATFAHLESNKLKIVDITTNEVAKTHIRHMVGGRAKEVHDERLFAFQFPERPGALLRFLNGMAPNWNISLFHYRNHGADIGRVLVGMQVPQSDSAEFDQFLKTLDYKVSEETDNVACRAFL